MTVMCATGAMLSSADTVGLVSWMIGDRNWIFDFFSVGPLKSILFLLLLLLTREFKVFVLSVVSAFRALFGAPFKVDGCVSPPRSFCLIPRINELSFSSWILKGVARIAMVSRGTAWRALKTCCSRWWAPSLWPTNPAGQQRGVSNFDVDVKSYHFSPTQKQFKLFFITAFERSMEDGKLAT